MAQTQTLAKRAQCLADRMSHDDPTREVDAEVVMLIPAYHQAKIRSRDGRMYSITRHTAGVALNELTVGQRLRCTVTVHTPRVVSAELRVG